MHRADTYVTYVTYVAYVAYVAYVHTAGVLMFICQVQQI